MPSLAGLNSASMNFRCIVIGNKCCRSGADLPECDTINLLLSNDGSLPKIPAVPSMTTVLRRFSPFGKHSSHVEHENLFANSLSGYRRVHINKSKASLHQSINIGSNTVVYEF